MEKWNKMVLKCSNYTGTKKKKAEQNSQLKWNSSFWPYER